MKGHGRAFRYISLSQPGGGGGGRLCPTIGFALTKTFRDNAPVTISSNGLSELQPIFLVQFQYKTTQSILFTPNSVYCLSNIATATATEVSLLKKRFNFLLFHQIHPVSSVIELQSHFKWSIHFHFEIEKNSMIFVQ